MYMRLLCLSILVLASTPCRSDPEDYRVIFGHVEKQANGAITITAGNRIPLRLKETGYEFGVLIESLGTNDAGLSGYVEYLLPAPAGGTSGSVRAIDKDKRIIRQQFSTPGDTWLGNVFFHKHDPLGEWRVSVVVSDEEIFAMKFQVYEEIIIGNSDTK